MSLLVVGTVAFDTIETQYKKAEYVVGGAGLYFSLAASYLSQPIYLSSIVGGDFPELTLKDLEKRGVSTKGIEVVKDKKSFYWAGRYFDNMNQRETLVTDLNVLADFNPILPVEYKKADYIMLGNLTPAIQSSVLDQAINPKLVVLDTMNFWMDTAWDELHDVISRVDLITINDEEARQLSGEYTLINAARKIRELGPKYLIIKKGENGALLFGPNDQTFFAPALPLARVDDPTGAGDSFAGGLMGYLSYSKVLDFENLKRAVVYGSAMASFCVEAFSIDRLATLSKAEIDNRILRFKEIMQVDL